MNRQPSIWAFLTDSFRFAIRGELRYHLWMGTLTLFMIAGGFAYTVQLTKGLVVTGMSDHVSWGLYISNFTFLVGLAAAAVMLVMPAYVLKDVDFSKAVLVGEGVAVAALIMCITFVTVDLGGPQRLWHFVGINWPQSMLAWDVLVLNGYLALNLLIPAYLLYSMYSGREPNKKYYMPFIFLSVFWAVSIHLVTAFLYSGLPARPFWNTALMGPRFLASAFAAGPAFIIVVLGMVQKHTSYDIKEETLHKLAMITTVAAQINLIMLGSELFKEFYQVTEHANSAIYLFFGLDGKSALVPWIWTAIIVNVTATGILMWHPFRRNLKILIPTSIALFVAIWIEKGMGLIVPGFIPSPLGEVVDYTPSWVEIFVTAGIWAMGMFVLTLLVRIGIGVETGSIRPKQAAAK